MKQANRLALLVLLFIALVYVRTESQTASSQTQDVLHSDQTLRTNTRLVVVDVVATDLSADMRRFELISQGQTDEKLEFARLDVTNSRDVSATVADRGITHVIHLAGLQMPFCAADPPLGAMVNVVGTVNVFEAIRVAGGNIGLAIASSAAVYGNSADHAAGLVADSSSLMPDSFYGVYKAANEGTAKVYAIEHSIGSICLRP